MMHARRVPANYFRRPLLQGGSWFSVPRNHRAAASFDIKSGNGVSASIGSSFRIILVEDASCSSSDESHDAILGLYRQRFDIQIGVAELAQILSLWKPE
jgi:hypothetical protein